MLAVFAQFVDDVRRERQAEGIAKAKKAGVYTGGKARIDRDQVQALATDGQGPAAIARALGISLYVSLSNSSPRAGVIRECPGT